VLQAAPTPCAITACACCPAASEGRRKRDPGGADPPGSEGRQVMDRASFELVGNVGKLEIKPLKDDRNLAIISLATSERWKTEAGDWTEKTYWHRVAGVAPAKVKLIEAAVQEGTRLRLVGQIRPGSWEDHRGQTRHSIEVVVTGLAE